MHKLLAGLTVVGLSVAVLLWQAVQALGDPGPIAPEPVGFAVLELFTSEGCSSCPAADRVLSEISAEHRANVFPLSFHVDYWDNLGWRDAFGDRAFSARQRRHAEVLGGHRVYTPQVVVNGRAELIGSRRTQIEALVARFVEAPRNPTPTIALSVRKQGERELDVRHHVSGGAAGTQLTLLLVQSRAQSHVTRGENASLELTHSNVVRALASASSPDHTTLKVPDGLDASEVSVVALLEQSSTLATVAAARASVVP